jgi:hypothetical protein
MQASQCYVCRSRASIKTLRQWDNTNAARVTGWYLDTERRYAVWLRASPRAGSCQRPGYEQLCAEVSSCSSNAMIRTSQQGIDDTRRCQHAGIQQLTFGYRTGRVDEMLKIIEHFAAEVVPAVGDRSFSRDQVEDWDVP